jgi:hypothetical protein
LIPLAIAGLVARSFRKKHATPADKLMTG